MYGLVNKAVEGLVLDRFGEATWSRILQRAGMDDEGFVSMENYDDAVTYRLVEAASAELGLSAAQVLDAFGEYWTRYTAQEGYGDMLRAHGGTMRACLKHLDAMHDRIGRSYPGMKPPSFRCVDLPGGDAELHYVSERAGLAPMVLGLVRGLGVVFDETVSVEWLRRDEAGNAEVFLIRGMGA